jgi:hypothetical protein
MDVKSIPLNVPPAEQLLALNNICVALQTQVRVLRDWQASEISRRREDDKLDRVVAIPDDLWIERHVDNCQVRIWYGDWLYLPDDAVGPLIEALIRISGYKPKE